jgi:hypothetical protein
MKLEFIFIGKCCHKGCNSILRVTIPAKIKNHTRNINYFPGCNNPPIYEKYQTSEPAWHPHNLGIHCTAHKWPLGWRELNGTHNPDHVCDARCTGAKGHSCDCSCGGANHGADYAVKA